MKHINRIRFGYGQNPEAFNVIKHLYQKKEEKQHHFLDKLEHSRIENSGEEKSKESKHMEAIETSRFNKNCFLEKQLRRQKIHQR
jgi:hypothetical protein